MAFNEPSHLGSNADGRYRPYSAFLPYLFSKQTSYPIEYVS